VPDVLAVALAGAATALATGLGAVPVFFLGARAAALRPVLWGLAAGVMAVASWQGLLAPALREGTPAAVAGGLAAGVAFLVLTRRLVRRHEQHAHGTFSVAHARAVLVVIVLSVHSLPEGFAIGTAWGSGVEGLGIFVLLAIALQNIPEGTVTAIPMAEAGASRSAEFWTAVLTSVPQPVGAVAAYLLVETVDALLAVSFAFAAGAMLALTVTDLLPEALRGPGRAAGLAGIAAGAATMAAMAAVLRV
jgi:zinc transporter, ZIP family